MQGHDDGVSAASTTESVLSFPADGNGSTRAETCASLESSLSSLITLLRDKEDELKALRTKVDCLQESCHKEILERTRLAYEVQSIESEHQQAMKVHQLELDVALAQKKAAWSQISASAEKHRTEIHALQMKHAAELERLRQEAYTITSSTPTLHTARHAVAQHNAASLGDYQDRNSTGAQIPPQQRADESAYRKDLRKADGAKMAKLMSAGDSISTATHQIPGNNAHWQEAHNNAHHHGATFPGAKVRNTLQNRGGTGIEDIGPRTMYQNAIPPGTHDDEISALTLQTFEQELNDRALDEQRWPPRNHEAVPLRKTKTPMITTTPQQGPQAEPLVIAGPTVQPLRKVSSDGVDPVAIVKRPDTSGPLSNTVSTVGDDWEAVHEEHDSAGQSTTTGDDDDQSGPSEVSTTYGEDQVEVVDKVLSDPYGDRGVYTGVVLLTTGMPHGTGRIQYAAVGRSYDGEWRHGRWYGLGKATFSNGDTYEGMYVNDKREGPGVYKWRDGRVYDGEFKDDKRHGKGTFIWPDGSLYDGDFFNGQRDGHGIYQYADGGRYEGGWEAGRYSGVGTCVWVDGRKYHGEWKAGACNGQGVETLPDGTIRHDGQWYNDEPLPG